MSMTQNDIDVTLAIADLLKDHERSHVEHEFLNIALNAFDKYIVVAGVDTALQVVNAMASAIDQDAAIFNELHSVLNTAEQIGEL